MGKEPTFGDLAGHLVDEQCIKYTGVPCATAFDMAQKAGAPPSPPEEGPGLLQRAGHALDEAGNAVTEAINGIAPKQGMDEARMERTKVFNEKYMP